MRHSLTRSATLAALLLVLSFAASAQPAATASAPRPGMGPGAGMGPGGGMHGHMGRGRAGPGYTPGWSMMTPQERDAHRAQMRGATTAQECRKLMDEHHALMEQRAQERGMRMRGARGNACGGFTK